MIEMVTIFTGAGTGLVRGSGAVLGARGQIVSGSSGRASENIHVNAANGNLVVTHQDEFLVGLGADASVNIDHNSLVDGSFSYSFATGLRDFTGTTNTAGSTVTRWNGESTVYTYDVALGAYVAKEGAGAYDEVRFANNVWSWTDGDTGMVEYFEYSPFAGKFNLTRTVDRDGNTLTRTYSGNMIQTIATASGETVSFEWTDGKISAINELDSRGVVTRKTRLTWDTVVNFRLASITVDLTPADGSIADGNTYVTSFTFDGSSKRVASMTQSDGSRIDVTYVLVGTDYRVATLSETIATGVTATTSFSYDTVNRITTLTDTYGQATQIWYDAQSQLSKIVAPPAVSGGAAQVRQFAYNANGDVVSVTDAAGDSTTYTYDSNGNLLTETDRLGNVVTRTYGAQNQLLTETRYGADAASADAAHTTRYVYDSRIHLRYVLDAEGGVTEYRYDRYGQRVAELEYTENLYDLTGLASGASPSEATLNAWSSAAFDRSSVKRTNTYYDFRGNVSSVVSYSTTSRYGDGADSPLVIVPGAGTTVSQEPDGLYRVTKTSGAVDWNADATSLIALEGDFVLRLRPGQNNAHLVGGVARAPGASAHYSNPDYGLYFTDYGSVNFMESGVYAGIGAYTTGDNFWLVRSGSTINYYKGATLAAAMAAGTLRTQTGATGALYFDSSLYSAGAVLDVDLSPLGITNGTGTTVTARGDGLYRITKTGNNIDSWDSDARSTTKADGDFVLRLRPAQANAHLIGGVATSPGASAYYTNPDYGFYFTNDGTVHYMEAGSYSNISTYAAGDNFWLVRSGSTISYYKGATLEAAIAAGALRARTGATGTFYFDSSFYSMGGALDAAFTPSPIVNGLGTSILQQPDGLYRITKVSGPDDWNADARSSTRAEGDFVLRLRPAQNNKYFVGGVATAPAANLSYTNPLRPVLPVGRKRPLHGIGQRRLHRHDLCRRRQFLGRQERARSAITRARRWRRRWRPAPLRTRTGVSGTFHFDSSSTRPGRVRRRLHAHSNPPALPPSSAAPITSTIAAGRLLSRVTDGQQSRPSSMTAGPGRSRRPTATRAPPASSSTTRRTRPW
jgi:YD repeat-containing protein